MLNRRIFVSWAICSVVGLVASHVKADALATSAISRTVAAEKTEFPGDKYVSILMAIDIEANALIARQTHPGVESSYLATGSLVLSVHGQPDRAMKAGDGAQVPPGVPHSVRNGPEKSRVVATYIVEKGKPLLSLAPE